MKLDPDITLTLLTDDFDGYGIMTHSSLGASFIKAYLPTHDSAPSEAVTARQARLIAHQAEKKGLAVRVR